MIYLDVAATTKPKQEVIEAMMPYFTSMWQNPSSLYSSSVKVRNAVEQARNTVAKFINANSDEIIFTSGGSESNCSVIQGFVQYCRSIGRKSSVITSKIEHKSIILSVESVAEDFHFVDVDSEGFIRLDALWSVLNSIPKDVLILVSLQFANNEIGTIQHIKEISEIVHSFGCVFHTDAVQAFGHEKIDVKKLGIDLLSASGHKIGTPKGIGILYKKKGVNIFPIIYGTQEHGMRGGTENVPYIIGLAKAVELLNAKGIYDSNFIENEYHLKHCRNYLLNELEQMGCVLNGSYHRRLSNNINVTFPQNIAGEALIYMLDSSDIQISAGSACNSHSQAISHVLAAIGLSEEKALRTVRITLSEDITDDELDLVVSEFKKAIDILDILV